MLMQGERVPDFIEFIDVQCLEQVTSHAMIVYGPQKNEELKHNLKPTPIKMKIRKITLKTKPSMFFRRSMRIQPWKCAKKNAIIWRTHESYNNRRIHPCLKEGYPRGGGIFFPDFFSHEPFRPCCFLGGPRAFNHICLPTILTVASMSKDGCAQGEQRLNGVIGLQHKGIWLPPELWGFRGKLST